MNTRIKFCGLTRSQDVQAAAASGAHALGFIFAAGSPRQVGIVQLDALLAVVPVFVTPVVLFRDNTADEVSAVLSRSPRWVAQFHGDESPAFCAGFGRAWLKAVPMGGLTDAALTPFLRSFSDIGCAGFVFDSHGGATTGGSGRAFDWSRIPRDQSAPVILAGGLTPDTVGDAVRRVRPFAVDVSSGIESAPAIKGHAKMCRFADEVFRARTD